MQIAVLGIDLGKNSCSLAGLDTTGAVVKRRRMRPESIPAFTKTLQHCVVAMETCCGAHHLGRLLTAEGHAADVTRIRAPLKQPRQNPHEGITHLGGDGWKWTRDQVVQSITARSNTFFTLVAGTRADVGVVDGPNGKYVRTHADAKWNDNLLALPECV